MRLSWLREQHWSLYAAGAAAVFCLSTCSGPISRILHFREDHDPLECIVLVTGCDSGMGIIMVRTLLSRGYRVLALCLTIEGAERLYAENSGGGKVEALNTIVGDVTKQEDVDRVGKVGQVGKIGEIGKVGKIAKAGNDTNAGYQQS